LKVDKKEWRWKKQERTFRRFAIIWKWKLWQGW